MTEAHRIRNGTNVTIGDWVGYVVDQSGPDVWVTVPGGVTKLDRSSIEKRGRHYVYTTRRVVYHR